MAQSLALTAIVVADYDDAIDFYCGKLGFDLVEDEYQPDQNKRWVVVRPKGGGQAGLLLARGANEHQRDFIGNQCGGRVFLFLATDQFDDDFARYKNAGVRFVRSPTQFDYGQVAVFEDLYGNRWDLVQYSPGHPMSIS